MLYLQNQIFSFFKLKQYSIKKIEKQRKVKYLCSKRTISRYENISFVDVKESNWKDIILFRNLYVKEFYDSKKKKKIQDSNIFFKISFIVLHTRIKSYVQNTEKKKQTFRHSIEADLLNTMSELGCENRGRQEVDLILVYKCRFVNGVLYKLMISDKFLDVLQGVTRFNFFHNVHVMMTYFLWISIVRTYIPRRKQFSSKVFLFFKCVILSKKIFKHDCSYRIIYVYRLWIYKEFLVKNNINNRFQ